MPKLVDHEERRRDIVDAGLTVLGEAGLEGFTLRAVAERLGGSVTLVTHYYSSRRELLDDMAGRLIGFWESELEEVEQDSADPVERLRRLLQWLIPVSPEERAREYGRFHLLAARDDSLVDTARMFQVWEDYVQRLLKEHLEGLLPEAEIPGAADLLRAVTNGLSLSSMEHPDTWPAERIEAVLDRVLGQMSLHGRATSAG